ncbi:MAG: hypothetical protein JNG86_16585 [Verrucomicrobiaceae bacterium]|nr:hypothetical protein [Verrucomicrobiaceae bacterium]
MTVEAYRETLAQGAAVNLSARAKFRLTGADRVRYLNGQVTNDIRRASASETIYACVTDVKGRISGDVFVHANADALLLDAEPGLRESLGMRLERYIVADDVELTDVTEEWQLWHVFGPSAVGELKSTRFGVPGVDVWLPADAAFEPAIRVLSDEEAETWRILQKVPRWPHELNAETFPPEASLEARAMDFAKGCYIGQEVLSRIKTTGKMPREMISFACDTEVKVGDEVWSDKSVGRVTSVATHPETGKSAGLAMVRQGTAKQNMRASDASGPLLIVL